MKNTNSSHNKPKEEHIHSIPDIDIIDLDLNSDTNMDAEEHTDTPSDTFREPEPDTVPLPKRILSHINMHVVLLIVVLAFISGIVYKILTWGVLVDPDDILPGDYNNSNDVILPLTDATGHVLRRDYSGNINILAFGNSPFADDRESEDNLLSMIGEMTGATIYNCSVSGSYLAAELPYLQEEEYPMDAFNFYWLCFLATGNKDIEKKYLKAVEILGEDAPKEAMDVYNTLTGIDLNDIDVITIMYDGSDYLAGHEMYNDENSQDILQFTGNMEAGLAMLQENYPNIRFIVLSPPYAYGLDENGNYVSSDIQRYGWDVLSTYVIRQAFSANRYSVTFVDNLYGTIHEDNASQYLIDHIHLNVEGRKKVAERFVKALYYFND